MHPNDAAMARVRAAEQATKEQNEAAFASDLGLKPGEWPASLDVDGALFLRGEPKRHGGELVGVEYYRPGARLMVWND